MGRRQVQKRKHFRDSPKLAPSRIPARQLRVRIDHAARALLSTHFNGDITRPMDFGRVLATAGKTNTTWQELALALRGHGVKFLLSGHNLEKGVPVQEIQKFAAAHGIDPKNLENFLTQELKAKISHNVAK